MILGCSHEEASLGRITRPPHPTLRLVFSASRLLPPKQLYLRSPPHFYCMEDNLLRQPAANPGLLSYLEPTYNSSSYE